jgi:hypothetical protein
MQADSFVEYRKSIELKYPLAAELTQLHLGFLPPLLERWKTIKELTQERLSHRPADERHADERLSIDDVSYILCCAGLGYSREEIFSRMILRAKFEKVTDTIVRSNYRMGYVEDPHKYAKILLGLESHRVSPITKDFIYTIKPATLAALAFSRHEPPAYPTLYQFCVRYRSLTQRALSWLQSQVGLLYDVGVHLKERMVFRDFVPALLSTFSAKSSIGL